MGATLSVVKTLFLPAIIALLVFVLFSFVIVPIWQHYRNRYSHYLPIDTLSSQTLSLRDRMQASVSHFFSRATTTTSWRDRVGTNGGDTGIGGRLRGLFSRRNSPSRAGGSHSRDNSLRSDELLSDSEELSLHLHNPARGIELGEVGEELGTMRANSGAGRRQHELPRGGAAVYDAPRLSRELEQGFMDDSDDDEPPRR
ncbi:hypothetical protein SPBR_03533 [Sporothrix brasiliensis 5110]|uniref:Uncharacterized protein n=1 Tax=Sporothrix brasiliensis 5110 TaxID=1398154 RepID=A0A0C2F7Q7_9PEZI|nr:uncharacterized protein SPBR_03533 [Sporothrix brasiliensis 5110]KIH95054.1 hypothetical protein SPBR_03533 [Sporothrix brasiliensis 5110]